MLVEECAAANRRHHHHCLPLELCNEMILFASCDTLANLTKLLSSSSPTGGSGDSIAFLAERQLDKIKIKVVKWNNNKWHISDQKRVRRSAKGLTITKTNEKWDYTSVRAQQPISRAFLTLVTGSKFVYWEVAIKKEFASDIGWVGPNYPLNSNKWIGHHPDSFAIDCFGNYRESGRYVGGYGKGFGEGAVLGTGLLLTFDNRLKLFFTLNGELNGEPIVLKKSQDLLVHPAISLYGKETSVEANFGADTAGKPFKFDANAHETVLFG